MSSRLDNLFGTFPSFTCEELGVKANDFSNNITAPIQFTQMNFWLFFAMVYFVFCFVYKNNLMRSGFLLLVSLFFYFKTSGLFVSILIFSMIVDYFIGNRIHKSNRQRERKTLLILSMSVNLFVLAYFKYAYFFTDSYNYLITYLNDVFGLSMSSAEMVNYFAHWNNSFFGGEVMCASKIILPVGISFYTFQTMSYSIDIYRKELTPVKNFIDFGFFVTFFPQLVAGPIVRAKDFIPQIYKPFQLTRQDFGAAVWQILRGLTKKMVVADFLALNLIDRVFQFPDQYSGYIVIVALIGYSMQIYGDFSGYTDIAIGVSRLMGFHLNPNFNSPYKATSVADFWKRWHISLSTWLKDYLYIPLGGNKKASVTSYIFIPFIAFFMAGVANYFWGWNFWLLSGIFIGLTVIGLLFESYRKFVSTDINLLITMLLGGFWHGAEMKFIIWGGLNGIALVIYKYWKRVSPYEKSTHWMVHAWKIFITFNFITFTRVFFRAESMENAVDMLHQINYQFSDPQPIIENGVEMGYIQTLYTHFVNSMTFLFENYFVVMIVFIASFVIHWLPNRLKASTEEIFINSHISLQAVFVLLAGIFIYQFYSAFAPFAYFAF